MSLCSDTRQYEKPVFVDSQRTSRLREGSSSIRSHSIHLKLWPHGFYWKRLLTAFVSCRSATSTSFEPTCISYFSIFSLIALLSRLFSLHKKYMMEKIQRKVWWSKHPMPWRQSDDKVVLVARSDTPGSNIQESEGSSTFMRKCYIWLMSHKHILVH